MKPGIIRQGDVLVVPCADIPASAGRADAENGRLILNIMHEISMSCLRWYPRDGLIIACERPAAVHLDERERLHNDLGPVIEFRDGWKIYRIHDVDVSEWLFTDPQRLTIDTM